MQTSFEIIQRLRDGFERMRVPDQMETGCSPRTAVWRDGKRVLYRYEARCARRVRVPLLICYALVNRPYMMDLQPGRSMIQALLDSGIDVFLIDWGYPDAGDRFADLNGYINETLDDCVEHLKRFHRMPSVNLLGVCQGGTLSVCYAAAHPEKVKNLITMVTPIDFKTPDNLLSKWAQFVDVEAMTRSGNISGDFLNFVYLSLMPFRLTQQKYLVLEELAQDPSQLEYFLRMERWIFDSPDQAAQAFSEFLTWFFKENRLIEGGLTIGGIPVRLENLTCPVLNIFALKDHLVPPSASMALGRYAGSADYSELSIDVGHIGMYVSGKARSEVPQAITRWLEAHDA